MFDFFYNFLATFTGGRAFKDIRQQNLAKTKKALKGAKFSKIDTQVFTLLTQRKPKESFLTYFKRNRKLNALSVEDKQILINSEKKRLAKVEEGRNRMLNNYLGVPQSQVTQDIQSIQNQTSEQVGGTVANRLSKVDASIFSALADRNSRESDFAFLKRRKAMYALPIEKKLELVHQERFRIAKEEQEKETMLKNYLTSEPTEEKQVDEIPKSQPLTLEDREQQLDEDEELSL